MLVGFKKSTTRGKLGEQPQSMGLTQPDMQVSIKIIININIAIIIIAMGRCILICKYPQKPHVFQAQCHPVQIWFIQTRANHKNNSAFHLWEFEAAKTKTAIADKNCYLQYSQDWNKGPGWLMSRVLPFTPFIREFGLEISLKSKC